MTPGIWIPIATRLPTDHCWLQSPSAPVGIEQARRLYEQGKVELAQRRQNGHAILLVYQRHRPARPRQWFTRVEETRYQETINPGLRRHMREEV